MGIQVKEHLMLLSHKCFSIAVNEIIYHFLFELQGETIKKVEKRDKPLRHAY